MALQHNGSKAIPKRKASNGPARNGLKETPNTLLWCTRKLQGPFWHQALKEGSQLCDSLKSRKTRHKNYSRWAGSESVSCSGWPVSGIFPQFWPALNRGTSKFSTQSSTTSSSSQSTHIADRWQPSLLLRAVDMWSVLPAMASFFCIRFHSPIVKVLWVGNYTIRSMIMRLILW